MLIFENFRAMLIFKQALIIARVRYLPDGCVVASFANLLKLLQGFAKFCRRWKMFGYQWIWYVVKANEFCLLWILQWQNCLCRFARPFHCLSIWWTRKPETVEIFAMVINNLKHMQIYHSPQIHLDETKYVKWSCFVVSVDCHGRKCY